MYLELVLRVWLTSSHNYLWDENTNLPITSHLPQRPSSFIPLKLYVVYNIDCFDGPLTAAELKWLYYMTGY